VKKGDRKEVTRCSEGAVRTSGNSGATGSQRHRWKGAKEKKGAPERRKTLLPLAGRGRSFGGPGISDTRSVRQGVVKQA